MQTATSVASTTDKIADSTPTPCMETPADRKVLSADRYHDDVLIAFDDGKTAVYPAYILYACLGQIEKVITDDGPEE